MLPEGSHIDRAAERELEHLSPFELKTRLIELVLDRHAELLLNAGRGNPNWVATTPRDAFFLLGRFALDECRRVWDEPGIGGMPERTGIAARLDAYLDRHPDEPGTDLLRHGIVYGLTREGLDPDDWVHELVDGIIGDNYPEPDRMLPGVERVVNDYLMKELCGGQPPDGEFDLFAVEGGTAAMCYIFETLAANNLLNPGDRIALGVPVFTPYLEIPELPRYTFDVEMVVASEVGDEGLNMWQYPEDELMKLADPSIRAFFLVNPSNPPSVMVRPSTLDRIAEIIRDHNPNLIVITDDVYGTFVPGFRSLMAVAPRNTIGVYSFSKYFGCTGWRLGVVAIHRDNVFDELLASLPDERKALLARRYQSITLQPEKLPLIARMVADSRHVALNHTAGLSLPQQVQMALFSLAALLDDDDAYQERIRAILRERFARLCEGMGVQLPDDPLRAGYYAELDLLLWADERHGSEFVEFLTQNYEPVDMVFRLAEQESVVLLHGGGFHGPEWSVRVSLANLDEDDYLRVGQAIARVAHEYVDEFVASRGASAGSGHP
jgi:aspartate 4-decarboxylase